MSITFFIKITLKRNTFQWKKISSGKTAKKTMSNSFPNITYSIPFRILNAGCAAKAID